MAEKRFFSFIEVKYTELTNQIDTWMKGLYNKSAINMSPASPYGQILEIQKELFQHNIIYLKNAVNQINIEETTNDKVIRNIARIAGHSPSRAISASGTLKFKLKPGIDIADEIKDQNVIINDETTIKNKSNSLDYTIKLGTEKNIYPIAVNSEFYVTIVQGKFETQKFTGDGTYNQSFRANVPTTASIENFNYTIRYNGSVVSIKDHKYDMLPGELACYVRTGFNGGLDVFFGSKNFGFIPATGSLIEITYLLTNGLEGEVLNPVVNDWRIIDDILDGKGNPLKMEDLFDIFIETPVNFSADAEDSKMMKQTIPYVSRNFVLATPDQFIFHLRRLNMFSKVNAFNKLNDNDFSVTDTVLETSVRKIKGSVNRNDSRTKINTNLDNFLSLYSKYKTNMNDNEIYLYLIPDVRKYFNDDMNYFNVPFDVFYLDDDEQSKVLNYLRQVGTMSMTTNIKIVQPTITRYVLHVYVRKFSNALEDNIEQEIIASISDYLLVYERFDRLPVSDLLNLVKNVSGVDSTSLYFVSKENEDYHRKAIETGLSIDPDTSIFNPSKNASINQTRKEPTLQQPVEVKNGIERVRQAYDPNLVLGLDPVHGDIIVKKDEYAIVRGGWRDRKGIWYNESANSPGLTSINITFNGTTQV